MPLLLYYGTNQAIATSRGGMTVSKLQTLMSRNVWNAIMFGITDKDDYFCSACKRNKWTTEIRNTTS